MNQRVQYIVVLLCCVVALVSGLASSEVQAQQLEQVYKDAPQTLELSRAFLLGERKGKRTVVRVVTNGQIINFQDAGTRQLMTPVVHPKGGPGTQYLYFNRNRKVSGVLSDYQWHQNEFKNFIEKAQKQNAEALKRVEALHLKLQICLAASLKEKGSIDWAGTGEFKALDVKATGWLGYSLNQLAKAVKAKDVSQSVHWIHEAEAAAFAVLDLHRWSALLYENQLFALDVMNNSEELFRALDPMYGGKYNHLTHIGRFPGGNDSLYGSDNYAEVERQAEQLFWYDKSWEALASKAPESEAAYGIFPDLREDYKKLSSSLTRKNLDLWYLAPHSVYERSYVNNMIWRAKSSNTLDAMGEVMKRFNRKYSRGGSLEELMNVIHVRGSYFAGLEFCDRYSGNLMKASAGMKGKNDRVAKMAHQFTYGIYGGKKNYVGLVLTLRESQKTGKMDCIRATDMIAAAYRNSGQAGYRMVRMYRGWPSHTVAAMELGTSKRSKIMTIDGLIAGGGMKAWPKGYASSGNYSVNDRNKSYAVQLYVRGLEAYLCAEAFYVYGPKKNKLEKAAIPFMVQYRK